MTKRIALDNTWNALALFALIQIGVSTISAQVGGDSAASLNRPAFAVSVVKASGPESGRGFNFQPGGRLVARNVTVRLLIKIAYNLNDDELTRGPAWIGLKRFDIDATPNFPDGNTVNMDRNRQRLQSLLADRFQLQLRGEMKTMSTYALVVEKGGPKLKKSQTPDAPTQFHGDVGALMLTNASMDQFANAVSDWVGHPVLNQTGLDGKYDLRLDWTPDSTAAPGNSASNDASLPADSGPTIFTALQEQLGLSLQARKNQALCQIVERVELPTEN